jgi:hypothetical protein
MRTKSPTGHPRGCCGSRNDLTVGSAALLFAGFTQSINSIDPPQQWFNGETRGYESGNFDLYSLGIDYDLGFGVLTSSTSYLDGKFGYLTGSYFGPFLGQGILSNDYIAHSAAQELQLRSNSSGPLHWLAGAFYQNASAAFLFDVVTAPLQADGNNKTNTVLSVRGGEQPDAPARPASGSAITATIAN